MKTASKWQEISFKALDAQSKWYSYCFELIDGKVQVKLQIVALSTGIAEREQT